MFTIHKLTLKRTDDGQTHRLPGFMHTLSVAEQNQAVVVYYLVDSDKLDRNESTLVTYAAVCTGLQYRFLGVFIGTAKLRNGKLMIHVFEQ